MNKNYLFEFIDQKYLIKVINIHLINFCCFYLIFKKLIF